MSRDLPGVELLRIEAGRLRLDADDRQTADINRALVLAGVAVSELRHEERELEDVFFAITAEHREDSHV